MNKIIFALFLLISLNAGATLTAPLGNATSIQGVAVSSSAPSTNQCLVATSPTQWAPGSCSSGSGIGGTWGATTGNVVTTDLANTAQDSGTALSSMCTLAGVQTLTNKTLGSGTVLPNPSATTLGGIESIVAASHSWINAISTSGVPSQTQPAFTDISGSVAASQLPNPSASALGGVQSAASVSHKWINTISTSGVPGLTQPDFSDLSGNIDVSQMNSGTGASATTYWRGDGTWGTPAGGSGVTTVGAFSASSQANGASISGSTITFGPADATNPGMVSTGAQTFAGDKTFTGNLNLGANPIKINYASGASINDISGSQFRISAASNEGMQLIADNGSITLAGFGATWNTTTAPWQLPQVATPSAPASGTDGIYFKSDDNLYLRTSAASSEKMVSRVVLTGQATLVAGTVTVSTAAVKTASLIFLTDATPGGTVGFLSVGTITDGTSFVINSSNALDTSTVNWMLSQ